MRQDLKTVPIEKLRFEQGPIRPPNEATSLLVRVTRNCPWNRCIFCRTYKGKKFEIRPVEEVKADIDVMAELASKIKEISWSLGHGGKVSEEVIYYVQKQLAGRQPLALFIASWLYYGGKTVFIQDANSPVIRTEDLAAILEYLREKFPHVERVTSYARSHTIARKSIEDLKTIRRAGLDRIHIGLESGCDDVLSFMKKGVDSAQHIEAGLKAKEAGMELSEYVILGLGGKKWGHQHALDTARVLSLINPHFIRLRTLAIPKETELFNRVKSGEFEPLDDDEIVKEEKILIENLPEKVTSYLASDHILNLLEEVEGKLPHDKNRMLSVIDRYLAMKEEKRKHFQIGRRFGHYRKLDDMHIPALKSRVDNLYRIIKERHSELLQKNLQDVLANYI